MNNWILAAIHSTPGKSVARVEDDSGGLDGEGFCFAAEAFDSAALPSGAVIPPIR